MIDVLAAEIDAGVTAGVVASPDPGRDARAVFALVLDGIHDVAVGRAEPLDEAAFLWRFCWGGLRGTSDSLTDLHPQEER